MTDLRPPSDPRVRAFLDALAEAVATSILGDLEDVRVSANGPEPRVIATPDLTTTAHQGGDRG